MGEKVIIRPVRDIIQMCERFSQNTMTITGLYRLLTYLKFKHIPKKYKEFFKEGAKEIWDNDISRMIDKKEVEGGIRNTLLSIIPMFVRGEIITAIGAIPMIMADIYMFRVNIDWYFQRFDKIIEKLNTFDKDDKDKNLLFLETLVDSMDLLDEMFKDNNILTDYNMQDLLEKILSNYNEDGTIKDLEKLVKDIEESKVEEANDGKTEEANI